MNLGERLNVLARADDLVDEYRKEGQWWMQGNRFLEDNEVALVERVQELEQALKEIRAKAAFELDNPTGLELTCLSIIRKTADEALEVPDELK